MAVLQAARAHVCGLPLDISKSWGINRAIFYAAAKRGFRSFGRRGLAARPGVRGIPRGPAPVGPKEEVFRLGDEVAYTAKVGATTRFTIGGEVHTEEDYERQIVSRFGGKYRDAWREAVEIVKRHPKTVLLSQNEFFQQVYKPVRDELSEKWTDMVRSE